MSVVFVNCTSETFTPTHSGAIATVLWELCQVAKAEGIIPIVITCPADAEPYPWEKTIFVAQPRNPENALGIALCRLQRRLNGWRYLRQKAFAKRVVRAVRERNLQRFPLIFHNDPEMALLFQETFPNAHIVHHFHNQHTCKSKMRRKLGAQRGMKITAVSDHIARWVEEFYALPANSVGTIHNGVNLDTFTPAAAAADRMPIVNFAGRTGIEKAPDLLLQAALLAAEKRRDFAVRIVGGNHWGYSTMDAYQQKLKDLGEALATKGVTVSFTGFVTRKDIPATFREADIHVVPSRWDEPCALTLFEGMASGLAMVASNTGGTPEIVGDAGLLFERDNAEELSKCLLALLERPEYRREMGMRARQRAERFTWAASWAGFQKAAGLAS